MGHLSRPASAGLAALLRPDEVAPTRPRRSVKLRAGRVLDDREMFDLRPLDPARVHDLLERLGAPPVAVARAAELAATADRLHVAVEGGATVTRKLYAHTDAAPAPYVALRWMPGGDGVDEVRYEAVTAGLCRSRLSAAWADAADAVEAVLSVSDGGPALAVSKGRDSVDVPAMGTGLTVAAALDRLAPAVELVGATVDPAIGGDALARVAAGTDRDGQPFLTLFHTVSRPGRRAVAP